MNALLLSGWLMLAWLPQGGMVCYEPPQVIDAAGSYFVELGVEATWGPLFAGGSMLVPVWQTGESLSFWPSQLISTTDLGLELGPVRLGWRHTCAHPVTPYLPVMSWYEGELVPRWDSGYDLVYLRLTTP